MDNVLLGEIIFICSLVALFVLWQLRSHSNEKGKKDNLSRRFKENIDTLPCFTPTHAFSPYGGGGRPEHLGGAIFIDVDQRKLCIARGYGSTLSPAEWHVPGIPANAYIPDPVLFSASKIQKLEIVNDLGQIVTQTVSQNVLGRALAGGALFGTTGAIVAGLSSPQISVSSQQQQVKLTFYLNDVAAPYHEFNFSDLTQARKCYAMISALIQDPAV